MLHHVTLIMLVCIISRTAGYATADDIANRTRGHTLVREYGVQANNANAPQVIGNTTVGRHLLLTCSSVDECIYAHFVPSCQTLSIYFFDYDQSLSFYDVPNPAYCNVALNLLTGTACGVNGNNLQNQISGNGYYVNSCSNYNSVYWKFADKNIYQCVKNTIISFLYCRPGIDYGLYSGFYYRVYA